MNINENPWTEADIATLRRMWPDSKVRPIAEKLHRSKNAVIGKAHRLGLVAKPSPIRPRRDGLPQAPNPPRPRTPRPSRAKGAPRKPSPHTPERMALIQRDYPTQRPVLEIWAEAKSLPGPPMSRAAFYTAAHTLGVRRPERTRGAPPPIAETAPPAPIPAPRPAPPPRALATAGTATFGGVRTCQWIEGDVRAAWGFCGDVVVAGRSWCVEHLRRVFARVRVDEAEVAP